MEAHGIIQPANSRWAAPIVIVRKKDGKICLCVDYWRLNSVTRVDAYPMPRIDDIIDRLGQAAYISTLDLTKGYWQVPVAAKDRPKTAFTTPFGLYQFTCMPFGLQDAPATFQCMMKKLVDGLRDFASAFLDDLIVFSHSWRDHLRHLDAVLQRLKETGLTAKPGKCQLDAAMQLGACGWWRRGEGRGVHDRGSRANRASEDEGGEDVPWPDGVLLPVRP